MQLLTRRLIVHCKVNAISFLIDTGADLSVIPHTLYKGKHDSSTTFELSAANGTTIHTYGSKLLE